MKPQIYLVSSPRTEYEIKKDKAPWCPDDIVYFLPKGEMMNLETIQKFGYTVYPKWVKRLLSLFGVTGKDQVAMGYKISV